MGRFGFGMAGTRSNPRPADGVAPVAPAAVGVIAPGAGWSGVAASGYGVIPTDPARTTAKPAMQLIVPPNQVYTDELLVGVYAGANDGGSLLANMGLQKVVAHYEGTSVDIPAPSFQTFADANGVDRTYFGWWVKLKRDGRDGVANLYFEAIPRDATMQRRVIGPHVFLPRAVLHDRIVEVAGSLPVIAGARYQSISAAADYCRTQGATNPLIRIIEGGDTYLPGNQVSGVSTYSLGAQAGRITIEATVPTRICLPPPATASALQYIRPKMEPVCYRGANITIDFQNGEGYYFEPGLNLNLSWFDGCAITVSGGRNSLLFKQFRSSIHQFRGSHYFTEVNVTNLPDPFIGEKLVRGCTTSTTWGDHSNGTSVIGCTAVDHDSSWYVNKLPSMTVTYTGAGATATIEAAGAGTKTFTARVDGTIVGTYVLQQATNPHHDNDANFHVHNLVDWINGLGGGWSATLLDDTRAGWTLSVLGTAGAGAFGAQTVKGVTLTLYCSWDVHADFSQTYGQENFIIADSIVARSICQQIFFKDGAVSDGLVINCAFDNAEAVLRSQFASTHSHIVVAHCSWSVQETWLRTDFTGTPPSTAAKYNPDAYCLFANNVMPGLNWAGTADSNLVIADNHLLTGAVAPSGSRGTTIGGTAADVFANPAGGDFTPRGELALKRKTPVVRFDLKRAERPSKAAAGAVA